MQDITQHRSLKDVLPSKNKIKSEPMLNGHPSGGDMSEVAESRRKGPMVLMWLIISGLVIFSFIIISTVFSKVTVEVIPEQARVILDNTTIQAKRSAGTGELEFGVVSVEVMEEKIVLATGTEKVTRKATGQITIFNNFDEKPQELVVNTRFQTPDGKIYRIQKAIVVPGMKKVDTQDIPGSVEVTVTADKAGADYNIALTDFTIPGFAGGPKFEKFSAKSKTPMTGGFIGEIKTVSPADAEKTRQELRQKLTTQTNNLKPQVPEDFILFDDALVTTFESIPLAESDQSLDANEIKIAEKAVASGFLFDKEKLSAYLAEKFIDDYDGEGVLIYNFDELKFTLLEKDKLDYKNTDLITITLSGNAHIVWIIDQAVFKDSIRGLNKKEFSNIISRFPAIKSVIPHFLPPWKRTIPDDPAKIKIKLAITK